MKGLVVVVLVGATLVGSLARAAWNYELLKKVAVAGTGGWDYVLVDEAARRVYIAHATQVDVMDADSLALVGTIPNTPGPHPVPTPPQLHPRHPTPAKTHPLIPLSFK